MARPIECYTENIAELLELTKKPGKFLEKDASFCDEIKTYLKKWYDFTKKEEIKSVSVSALPELIVKNFDLEQIWQQIELQNEPLLTHSLTCVSKLVVGKNRLLFTNLESKLPQAEIEDDADASGQEEEEMDLEDLPDEVESDHEERPAKKVKSSVVDDDFFKLDEMEQFLNAEEKRIADSDSGNDSEELEEEEDEDGLDLFEPSPEGEDDEHKMKTARYKDFFVEKEEPEKNSRRNKFLDGLQETEEEPRSSFEERQDRLARRIEEIEDDAVNEKPWQLKGEITAEDRPMNSLLEEIVEFDLTTRPAPVITEQTTFQLEDIIKQRIKDKVFDSVERKAKPVDTPLEYKKKLVLDQEKSKESLAQIYEREFLEQQAALDPNNAEKEEEEPVLHKEINTMMRNLFSKLDALSNFHFTPRAAAPELKIVSNLPAIVMEEVAPVATSDAALLPPEQVKSKTKGDEIGKNERTATDKKRQRRKKKLKQKIHAKKLMKVKPGLGNKYSKEKAKKAIEDVTKGRNVDKMNETGGDKSVKSSKAFFSHLQEEVKSQIKRKAAEVPSKSKKKALNAKKLKL